MLVYFVKPALAQTCCVSLLPSWLSRALCRLQTSMPPPRLVASLSAMRSSVCLVSTRTAAALISPPVPCHTATFAARDFRRCVHASTTATAAPAGSPATEKLSTRTDDDIINMLLTGRIRLPQLEDKLGDFARAGVWRFRLYVHDMCACKAVFAILYFIEL